MDALIAQYEDFVYPRPVADLNQYVAGGGHDYSDPSRMRIKFWPLDQAPKHPRILVAGCGANQAAILAHANPGSKVVGIDLSKSSLRNEESLKRKHSLNNLEIIECGLEDVGTLGTGAFDLIVSTGVLHHMPNPVRGLRARAKCSVRTA